MPYDIKIESNGCALEMIPGDDDFVRVELEMFTTRLRKSPSPFSRRQLLKEFKERVAKQKVAWISPGYHKSIFDMDLLKENFDQLGSLDWLHGKITVEPEFEDRNLDADHIAMIENLRSLGGEKRFPLPPHVRWMGRLFFTLLPELSQKRCGPSEVPVEIQDSLERFLMDHPEPSKAAFLIMRFRETRLHLEIYEAIAKCLEGNGIRALRADIKHYHDELYYNILTYMHGCGFGVAVFERIEEELFNPNISLEVGYLLAMQKPICILKDRTLKTLHTDLMGKLYKVFDPLNASASLDAALTEWLRDKALA